MSASLAGQPKPGGMTKGGMTKGGMKGGAMVPPPPSLGEVKVGKIIRWARRSAAESKGRFSASIGVSLLSQQLQQYSIQLLTVILSLLAVATGSADRAANAGFLDFLMPSDLKTAAILFAVLAVLMIVLQFLENTIAQWCDAAMIGRLQQRLHDRLLILGPKFHQQIGAAQTQQILSMYLRTAQSMFRQIIAQPILYGLSFVTAMIYLLNGLSILSEGQLGVLPWILLAAMILMPYLSWKWSGRLRQAFRAVTREEQELAVEFANSTARPLEVQLLNAGAQRRKAFAREVGDVVKARFRAIVRNELANQLQSATPRILEAVVVVLGIFMALGLEEPAQRAAAAGAIVSLVYFVPRAIAPIQMLLQFAMTVNNARPQLEMVIGVLEYEPEIKDPANPKPLPQPATPLALEGVTVGGRASGAPILDQLQHVFQPGKVTAIVGRSGSGKSTLLVALARLRDVDGGRVTLAGVDLREVSLADLRRNLAMLSQFPLFIDATVRDNLTLGRDGADDAMLEAACKAVGVWPALVNNSGGGNPLDGKLHAEANKGALSGGERRLLAFARLLLSPAPVVLLDEPTTGVDALTQKTLVELVRTRLNDRTVLLVDHDMDFVATVSDRIACLDNGRIVEVLEKPEFFAKPSLFRELAEARRKAIGGPLNTSTPLQGQATSTFGAPPPGIVPGTMMMGAPGPKPGGKKPPQIGS